ncbi:MAG: methyltransferase family protein [Terriglobales bacterium]
MTPGALILACWIGFYVYWTASAGGVKTTRERESGASQLSHRVPLLAAAVLLIVPFQVFHLGTPLMASTTRLDAASVAIAMVGLAVAVWARWTIGANWSSAVSLKEDHELVRHGPYRFVRNPIYTGMLLMLLGTALFVDQWRALLAMVLATAALWVKLKREERFMARQFPEAYPAYRAKVKALIPYVL